MESLIKDGQVTRGWIGVEPRELTTELAETFNLLSDQGVLITGVLDDGPAGRAGIKPGDVITQVDGTPVNNTTDLLNRVAALKPKTQAVINVVRGKQTMAMKITVTQRPRAHAPAGDEPEQ
jgi:S1-C subfamily serine protease